MSIKNYKQYLEECAGGKIYHLVIHEICVLEYPSAIPTKEVQLKPGLILSKRSGTQSRTARERYQIEDDVDTRSTRGTRIATGTIATSPANVNAYTEVLDTIQAGILIEIKDLRKRLQVYLQSLVPAMMSKCGDYVIVDGEDGDCYQCCILNVYPLYKGRINIGFQVARVIYAHYSIHIYSSFQISHS